MSKNKRGKQSFLFQNKPVICAWASVAGKKEKEGPLGDLFDITNTDTYFKQSSWELAEKKIQQLALDCLVKKSGFDLTQIDAVLSGDLLNQCISSSFTLKNAGVPHIGLYGACSTMAESLMLGAMLVDGGYADRAISMTSSHFASAERQYRFPLGYGGQRPPTSQWTVTGAGAALIAASGSGPRLESCTVGTIVDLGVQDANNMGAAMAPAAFETIRTHFSDLRCKPTDYDMIVTGDLGEIGLKILHELCRIHHLTDLCSKLNDCGTMIFDNQKQDTHAGGSGCGCSAVTLCSKLLSELSSGKLKRILFCGTGALMSPTSSQQGFPIPGICHAVSIVGGD